MAWAAAIDFTHERLGADLPAVRKVRPAWLLSATEDLRSHAEFQVIEAAGACGAFTKGEVKAFHGLLHRRNECAHPEDVYPGLNESLGYIEEIFKRIATLQKRTWP